MTALAALVALVLAAVPALAADSFGLVPGSFTASVANDQAGAHSDATTSFAFNADGAGGPIDNAKDIVVDLPPGVVGNPQAMPKCTAGQLAALPDPVCPVDSQVGQIDLHFRLYGFTFETIFPVYNMEPRGTAPAEFGFKVVQLSVFVTISVRPDDYGLRATISNIATAFPLISSELTLWGNPADPSHDAARGNTCYVYTTGGPPSCTGTSRAAGVSPKAFMRNPTQCGVPRTTGITIDSWQNPADKLTATSPPTTMTGCDGLSFNPNLTLRADSRGAGAPAGVTVDLTVPQSDEPGDPGTADLKKAVVTLPQGMTVNASSADGLQGCTPAQIGLGKSDDPTCPQASKIGSVQIDTPLLNGPLTGGVYLGKPHDNPFDSLLALYLVAQGSGVTIKLPGRIDADPATGRLTATFDDNPQMPFTRLRLHLNGGARASLVLPATCGTYATHAELTAWSGQVARRTSQLTVDQGCDRAGAFTPSLSAGTVDPVAGAASPFVLRFSRPDGQAELGAMNGSLPPGLLGVLASVPLCSAAQGAAGTCPAASRVGRVQVAAGAGEHPVWLPVAGQPEDGVYLTEPYRQGDVAGMSIVTRAVAGPFDLGTVVTKVYLRLRDEDQGIDMQSDRLPRILQGIPLALRDVIVTVDRKGFMVNPTNCSAMTTYANVFSQAWAKVPVTSRFQVGGCGDLAFSPIITAQAGGKGLTKRYEHPALRVTVRQPAGQAHLDKTNVVLPKELNIDLKAPALKASCPRDVYAKDECSPVATVGTVKAVTPLLREPLSGPAFLIQKKGQLPDIVMRLRNNRMHLDLIGVLDFLRDGRLITRVKGIPDAALSSFELNIKGGKNGSLLNRSDLCAHKRLTKATFKGQNGKLSRKSPVTRISGCAKAKTSARSASRRAARAASAKAFAARGAHASAVHSRAVGGRS